MRELKFRAWGKNIKEYLTLNGKEPYAFTLKDISDGCIYDINLYDIEQYTGLKDKNDKEIYEGDIVDYNDDGECIGVVKYDAPEFYLDADATNWARMFLKGAPHQRVIGNIHESPELLEDEKC